MNEHIITWDLGRFLLLCFVLRSTVTQQHSFTVKIKGSAFQFCDFLRVEVHTDRNLLRGRSRLEPVMQGYAAHLAHPL